RDHYILPSSYIQIPLIHFGYNYNPLVKSYLQGHYEIHESEEICSEE
ncbi:8300_t:CDS:2, partial [Funneliformis geosporum]